STGHTPERMAADVRDFIAHLKPGRRVVLVGWSLACSTTVEYVARHGTADLQGIVLVDGIVGEGTGAKRPTEASLAGFAALQNDRTAYIADFVNRCFVEPRPADLVEHFKRELGR